MKMICDDCYEEFNSSAGSFYKYQVMVWLCNACAGRRNADYEGDDI